MVSETSWDKPGDAKECKTEILNMKGGQGEVVLA
jgi:hypothetical protein